MKVLVNNEVVATSVAGARGPAGSTGADGAVGEAGPAGATLVPAGAWDVATAYAENEVVQHEGSSYYASGSTTGDEPPASPWVLFVAKGDTGATGATGPAGADSTVPGPAGADGEDGAPGADGLSAYEVAVAEGFVGDEAAWLASLVGPAGADGDDGAPGTPGADGSDGAPGADGDDGREVELQTNSTHVQWRYVGESEWTNLVALSELEGEAGATGAAGADGRTILGGTGAPDSGVGDDGDFYIDTDATEIYGPKASGAWGSATSLVGPQGEQGIQGEQGEQGIQGEQGEQGPAGEGSGDVVGPASAVSGNLAAYDGTTGKLLDDSGVAPGAFATAAQGDLADSATQPGDLGTAAAEDVGYFATAAQGALADSAVQPAANVVPIIVACSDETTALETGTAVVTFRMPFAMTLTAVRASVTTAPTDAAIIVDINEGGGSILSTELSIDATEKTSTTAASAAVISDTALADDAEITIDIDQVGSTIAGAGLKVALIGYRTV